MKEDINVFEYAPVILGALPKGILLTTIASHKINTMVIGWGALGIEWGAPIFTVFVRANRYTRSCLDQSQEFTINAPNGPYDKHIIAIAGSKSGRDIDKIAQLGLTLEDAKAISTPGIKEFPLILECKVIYRQPQDHEQIRDEYKQKFYPQDVSSEFHGANMDYHIAYYGRIMAAYLIK